jgi:hypothetical protein
VAQVRRQPRDGLLIGATSLAVLGPSITVLALLVAAAELVLTGLAPARQ